MNKQVKWLAEQSDAWVKLGLISRDQADKIRGLYPEPKAALPWGTIIFSGIGAVITGLGVILLLAYNWGDLSKAVKLSVIFAALAGSHAAGIWLFLRNDWRQQLGDAVCLLGSMMFGSGIWLVAQIYHIEEHFPNAFLIWGLGALLMAWAMPSVAQGLLAVALLCIWGCSESWGFQAATHWGPLLILFGAGALAWRRRSPLLLCFVLAAFSITLLSNASVVQDHLVFRVALNFTTLFVAIAVLSRRHQWFAEGAAAWNFFGWAGFLLCLYLLTFAGGLNRLLGWHEYWTAWTDHNPAWFAYGWIPLVLALLAWGVVVWPWRPNAPRELRPHDCTFEHWLIPLSAVACQVFSFVNLEDQKWFVAGVFNLGFLALSTMWMARGCREGLLRPTILGSLLFVALAFARYFDLFESLLARGFVFLVVGGILFAQGILFRRARQRIRSGEVAS